ncbi:uncharacterized protein LOC128229180 [Mya arenaria]|uniref:uncharacterized protein LOC128229180 n=1 Tax=Mya arenaria TaxID=6604 RepID=UPI0022E8EA51|nr:uncharacterized protein LOC128229180 [Mya arenaria]
MAWITTYILHLSLVIVLLKAEFTPTSFYHCNTNNHCNNTNLCCSYTPALGRRSPSDRQVPPDWDGMVHYCLPWKTEEAPWCSLRLQFSPDAEYYTGLCPCGPGLRCEPSDELDPHSYPPSRYGKCVTV